MKAQTPTTTDNTNTRKPLVKEGYRTLTYDDVMRGRDAADNYDPLNEGIDFTHLIPPKRTLKVKPLSTYSLSNYEDTTPLIDNLLGQGDGLLIYAAAKEGKTFVSQSIALMLAQGFNAGQWKAEKSTVLYIDGMRPVSTL